MMIHKTNAELEEILVGVKGAVDEKIVLPVIASYKIVKNRLAIEQALSPYRILRDEIINRYSDGTGIIPNQSEDFGKATLEILQVAGEYTDVDILEITIEELGEKELPLNVVSALGFMMK